jgi:cytochrome P450
MSATASRQEARCGDGAEVKNVRDLPGPRGLPILGNALQIDPSRLHLIAEEWGRKYGDYYRCRIGGRELLVMKNPEAIASVLRDRPEGFERTSRMTEIAKAMGFDGLFSVNGEQWRRQRPMVMAGLDPATSSRTSRRW